MPLIKKYYIKWIKDDLKCKSNHWNIFSINFQFCYIYNITLKDNLPDVYFKTLFEINKKNSIHNSQNKYKKRLYNLNFLDPVIININ